MQRRPTSTLTLVLLAGALAILASACSTPSTSQALDQESAEAVVDATQFSDQALLAMFHGGLLKTMTPESASQGLQPMAPNCFLKDPPAGAEQDADGDGIPASLDITATGECDWVSGSYSITDTNDNDASSGFSQTIADFALKIFGVTVGLDGSMTLRTALPGYRLDATVSLSVESDDGSASALLDLHPTYMPDDASDPFASGVFTLDGSLTYTSEGASYHLTRASTGLQYDRTCTKSFTGGSVSYADTAGNQLDVVFHGCDDYTATLNHEAL